MKPILLAIMGPTASGKTALAERLATTLDAQLINADAFQAYRGMDIGTAKPIDKARYALLDIKDPNEPYGVGEFVAKARELLETLFAQGRSAVVVGGTGLYIRALFEEYSDMAEAPDPELRAALNARLERNGLADLVNDLQQRDHDAASRIDLRNPVRVIRALERLDAPPKGVDHPLPPFVRLKLALNPPLDLLVPRIGQRTNAMVQNGWVLEVKGLMGAGYSLADPGLRAIGYRLMWEHLQGRIELGEAIATAIADTKRYAKRQRTWLRTEPKLVELDESNPFDVAMERIRIVLK